MKSSYTVTFTGADGDPAGTAYRPTTPLGATPVAPVVSREDWTRVAITTMSARTTTADPVTTRFRRRRSLRSCSLRIAAARTEAACDSARRVEVDLLLAIINSLRRQGSSAGHGQGTLLTPRAEAAWRRRTSGSADAIPTTR